MGSLVATFLGWLALAVPPTLAAMRAYGDLVAALVARRLVPPNPYGFARGTTARRKAGTYLRSAWSGWTSGQTRPADWEQALGRFRRQAAVREAARRTGDPEILRLNRSSRRWQVAAIALLLFGSPVAALLDRLIGANVSDALPFVGSAGTALAILAGWGVFFALRRRFSEPAD